MKTRMKNFQVLYGLCFKLIMSSLQPFPHVQRNQQKNSLATLKMIQEILTQKKVSIAENVFLLWKKAGTLIVNILTLL